MLVFEDERCLLDLNRVDEYGEQRWLALGTARMSDRHTSRVGKPNTCSTAPLRLRTISSEGRTIETELRRSSQALKSRKKEICNPPHSGFVANQLKLGMLRAKRPFALSK